MDVHSERRTWTCVRQGGQVLKTFKGWEGAWLRVDVYTEKWAGRKKVKRVGRSIATCRRVHGNVDRCISESFQHQEPSNETFIHLFILIVPFATSTSN